MTGRAAGLSGLALTTSLASVLDAELQNRAENVLRQRLRQARFPVTKTLDSFSFAAHPSVDKATVLALVPGDVVRTHHNAVFVGGTGRGKTHLAISPGLCCIQAGYRVRFTTVVALANEPMS